MYPIDISKNSMLMVNDITNIYIYIQWTTKQKFNFKFSNSKDQLN